METPFEEMKRFVRFTEEDSACLARLRPLMAPHYAWIADQFYDRIRAHPGASKVFSGPEQVERLKASLEQWADRLISGPHDEEYHRMRSKIGRVHVQVGLEQMYMFTAMSVIRESFRSILWRELREEPDRLEPAVTALHKMLDLDLAIMLETYREDYIARLFRSEKQAAMKRLAAIGEVAATVAHEVRNPLAGISGAMEVLREDLPADSPRREVIKEALQQVHRLDERVRDLLLFARKVDLKVEDVDVHGLLRGTLALLSEDPTMREIRVHIEASDNGRHRLDRAQIQEVLINLLLNSARAMEGRGEIFVSTCRRAGGALELVVEDTGPGITVDPVEEIFRPFFTTRRGGTGLGLSIARKMVEAHGGTLVYEPAPRGGARFVALIPPDLEAA